MLVLTRKSGEAIQIGDDISIKVSEISGNRVKLCIDAPQIVRILRAEIAEQMGVTQVRNTPAVQAGSDRRTQANSHLTHAAK
jgi:carbon storage regulator